MKDCVGRQKYFMQCEKTKVVMHVLALRRSAKVERKMPYSKANYFPLVANSRGGISMIL